MDNPYGTLYLIPSLLGEIEPLEVLPLSIKKVIDKTDHFIVENEKTARHFIKRVLPGKSQPSLTLFTLNKYTEETEYAEFLNPCLAGHDMGIISEAGVPGVADPGAEIVALAHNHGIAVYPLVGPNSILLALMASGMNGQNFCFNGYLPIEKGERKRKIKQLEKQSAKGGAQIFMETPYRNMKMLEDITTVCDPTTRLCIAADITLPTQFIQTKKISEWAAHLPDINKRPCIFIIQNE